MASMAGIMEERKRENRPEDSPFNLSDVFYEVRLVEEQGPGAYYVCTHDGSDSLMCDEYYVVERTSPIISEAAKRYGKEISNHPDLLLYPFDEEKSGYKVVEYELAKYARITNGISDKQNDLHSLAFYNMEYHPEYFGAYPAPLNTPKGYTTRYKSLENGVFWLETDQCIPLLALCYPVWECELSSYAKELGLKTAFDIAAGVNNTLGYLFFEEKDFSIAIYELLSLRQDWIDNGMVNRSALMNAIWKHHPNYAATHNMQEQLGLNDSFALLINTLGGEMEPTSSVDNMIGIDQNAGYDFLNL